MKDAPDKSPPEDPEVRHAILLVDDETRLAELARLALSGRFDVHATTSPEEALRIGADPRIRLVLSDFQMNEINGVELIRRLRANRPDLPCILFSGNLTRDSWAAAHNAGCRHVLAKPLALSTIISLCSALICPPERPPFLEGGHDFLESIPWQGALGKNLRALAEHLLANHNPIYLHTPTGGFPRELLLGLLPDLQLYPHPESPPPPLPLYTDITGLDLGDQTRIAKLIPTRRKFPWLIAAEGAPDDLLDRGQLSESLYLRLGPNTISLAGPADCPADTLRLCGWWLSSLAPSTSLSEAASEWLANRLELWDWNALLSLLREAASQSPDRIIETDLIQHAALVIKLGSDLSDIQRYSDFADLFTRELRLAWDLLGTGTT
jgi:CheY-like chemotaxis protein